MDTWCCFFSYPPLLLARFGILTISLFVASVTIFSLQGGLRLRVSRRQRVLCWRLAVWSLLWMRWRSGEHCCLSICWYFGWVWQILNQNQNQIQITIWWWDDETVEEPGGKQDSSLWLRRLLHPLVDQAVFYHQGKHVLILSWVNTFLLKVGTFSQGWFF